MRVRSLLAMVLAGSLAGGPAVAAPCDASLEVAWTAFPPFQMKDSQGRFAGVDMAVANALAGRTGCSFKWTKMPFKRILKSLEKGRVDASFALSKTDKRAQYLYFAGPYLPYESNIWVHADRDVSADSMTAFLEAGNRLGIVRGYSYPGKTQKLIDSGRYALRRSKSEKFNIRMLARGRIDGTIANNILAPYLAAEEGVAAKVKRSDIVAYKDQVYLALSRKSVTGETANKLDAALAEMAKDGTVDKIVKNSAGATINAQKLY